MGDNEFNIQKGMGLVSHVFMENQLLHLKGNLGIGQCMICPVFACSMVHHWYCPMIYFSLGFSVVAIVVCLIDRLIDRLID